MTDAETLQSLRSAIAALGLTVHHYTSPGALARHATRHKQDAVLAIYGGQRSRNRMAIVPAICEAFGLRFIGPDVYGRVVAQDKEISKRLALDCGVHTPPWRVVRREEDLRYATGLRLPVVVKPLLEGSSIGITQRNRATTIEGALELVRELLTIFGQPVLIEEFVPGREVAYSKIENARGDYWSYSEIVLDGDPSFFQERLFDAHEKLFPSGSRTVRNIDEELDHLERRSIDNLLTAFGRFGYCRVDGRLAAGKFHFLELTPDAWIAPRGQFAMSFILKGWTYSEVIAAVLTSPQ